jgi:DNA-directed RNA polymerase subunit RPC12/RpoP
MYQFASPYKCTKCGHEFKFSPTDGHSAPVFSKEVEKSNGVHIKSMPVCPQCWQDFLINNVGIGYCTEVWTKDGSDYDNAIKSK